MKKGSNLLESSQKGEEDFSDITDDEMTKVKMTHPMKSPKRTLDELRKKGKILKHGRAYKPYWAISCKVKAAKGVFWKKTIEEKRNFLLDAVTSEPLLFETLDVGEYSVPVKSLVKTKIDEESASEKVEEFYKRLALKKRARLKEFKVSSIDIIYRPIYVVNLQNKKGNEKIKSFFCDSYKTKKG